MTIVSKLKEYRDLRRMTQEDLSKASGISIRTIQRIEKGLSSGSSYTIKTLAKSLNIESTHLVASFKDEPQSNQSGILKLMNLSILTVFLIPFGNLIFPCIIFLRNKKTIEVNSAGKKILSLQILSTILLFFFTIILFVTIGRGNGAIPMPIAVGYILYVFISSIAVLYTAIGINTRKDILTFVPNLL